LKKSRGAIKAPGEVQIIERDGKPVFKGRLPAAEGAAFLKPMEAITHTIGQQEATDQESMSPDVSAETFSSPHCSLESDGCHFPLSATTARRLACDAALVTVLEDDAGNVLNVGRKTRTIPPAIRRTLILRDQGCRFRVRAPGRP
jgi:hypothetical protein